MLQLQEQQHEVSKSIVEARERLTERCAKARSSWKATAAQPSQRYSGGRNLAFMSCSESAGGSKLYVTFFPSRRSSCASVRPVSICAHRNPPNLSLNLKLKSVDFEKEPSKRVPLHQSLA